MLPSIREIIQQSDSNLLIVLHTYGSHYDYRKRYPQEFARYTPDLISAINKNNRSIMVNAYDNSVYYTDYVLDEIIKVLEGTQACTALFYSSDHGEDMMDDSRVRFLHASPTPTYYNCMWPLSVGFRPNIAHSIPKNMPQPCRMRLHRPLRRRFSIRSPIWPRCKVPISISGIRWLATAMLPASACT